MQEANVSPLCQLRSANRRDLLALREENREALLRHRRVNLHEIEEHVTDITPDQFKELLLKIKQKRPVLEVIQKIKSACRNYENIHCFLRTDGAFNALVRILICNDGPKQLEAAACLTNLACGPHKCAYKVAKGAGAYLVSFINGSNHFLQDQCAWAVGNIANDCADCFGILKAQGVLPALMKALQSPIPLVVQSSVFALNGCLKYEDSDIIEFMKSGFPRCLLNLLKENINLAILIDATFTLVSCCYIGLKHNLEVISIDTAEVVLNLLIKETENEEINTLVIVPLLRCLGYLSCSDFICEFVSLHSEFLKITAKILHSNSHQFQKELLWVFSNISASEIIPLDYTYLIPLFKSMKVHLNPQNSSTLQILYYLSCMASRSEKVCSLLQQNEILLHITNFLNCGRRDVENATAAFLTLIQKENQI